MKKLILSTLLLSAPVFAQNYEDSYDYNSGIQYQPYVTQEFADGLSGGMLNAINEAARRAGQAVREAIDRRGFIHSAARRQRMDRAQGHPTNHNRIYTRGGFRSRNV